MFGMGTIINTAAIVAGGAGGALFGRFLNEKVQETLTRVCGVSTLFIAITGALEQMLTIENGAIVSGGAMLVILCLTIGAVIGELLNLEGAFERFGEWLKQKTGNAKDKRFVDAFVTASLTVCIGAMAIVGSIEDGISGDYSILATKAVLDFIIIMVMSCSMGRGAVFSAIPVAHPAREHYGTGGACAPPHDSCRTGQPLHGGQCADFLRRRQSGVGQKSTGGKPAAGYRHCCGCSVSSNIDKRNCRGSNEPRRFFYFSNLPFFTAGSLMRLARAHPAKAKAVPSTTETSTSDG